MTPLYLTIHSTGNLSSTARHERAWLTNPANKGVASWHIVIDEREAIEAIPLNEIAWHAGDGPTGRGNTSSVSIEICESGNRMRTVDNAIRLTTLLLRDRGWSAERLRRHFDWSGKVCPRIFAPDNWAEWNRFRHEVILRLAPSLPRVDRRADLLVRGHQTDYAAYILAFNSEHRAYAPVRELGVSLGFNVNYKDGKVYVE